MKVNLLMLAGLLIASRHPASAQWSAQNSGTAVSLSSVKAVSSSVAWAAGRSGVILKTTNGGMEWISVGPGNFATTTIGVTEAVDESTAFVATQSYPDTTCIHRTTNGGTTWDTVCVLVGPGAGINGIRMHDAANGIAVGNPLGGKWTILTTVDGGTTWYRDTLHAPPQLFGEQGTPKGFAAVGHTNIWFSSEYAILHSSDAGTTWQRSYLPFVAVAAVAHLWFNTPSSGIVTSFEFMCTNCPGLVARTTNGGVTWLDPISFGWQGLPRCAGFGNSNFFVSAGGTIYRSRNKAETFDTSYVGIALVTSMSFVQEGHVASGWAVTTAGDILAFSETVTGVHDQTKPVTPQSFSLLQNYPNPFNPSTVIKFQVPIYIYASLKVYDVLGREVRTLVNEDLQPGSYEVTFDATGLAGGVYLCRLTAGEFNETRRLLLLR